MKLSMVSMSALALGLLAGGAAHAQDAAPAAPPANASSDSNANDKAQQANQAAEQQTSQGGGIAPIVVTAQKRAENVQNVPIAISAFTATALNERAVTSVASLSNITPNVTFDASTPFSGSGEVLAAYIRGIGANDFAFNLDPGVGVYLDGVYLARSVGANQDLPDVERVEVLKGPQGTLFGRNTIGGAISIVTHDPGKDFRFAGDVTAGRFSLAKVRGTVDIPITDSLRSSISFAFRTRNGYLHRRPFPGFDPASTEPLTSFVQAGYEGMGAHGTEGDENVINGRAKLKFANGGPFRVTLSADYSRSKDASVPNSLIGTAQFVPGPFAGVSANDLGPAFGYPLQTALDVVTGSSGFLFGGLYNFCISATPAQIAARNAQNLCGPRSGLSFDSLAPLAGSNRTPFDSRFISSDKDVSYSTAANFSHLKNYGGAAIAEFDLADHVTLKSITGYRELHWKSGMDLDGSPINMLQLSFSMNQWQFSQELQLLGSLLDNRLHYVFGGYYFKEAGDLHDYVTFAEGLLQVDGPNHLWTRNYAGFGQIDWNITDQFGVTLGGRYTHEDKKFEGFQADRNGFNYKLFNCMVLDPTTGLPNDLCRQLVGFPNPGEPLRYYIAGIQQKKFNNFSPKVGIQYHPTQDVMLYGSWSKGYKTGGWTTRLSNPLPFAPGFDEEKATTWEAGVKSTWLDRHLQLNAAAFTTKYTGIQLNFQQGVSPTIQNAGDARIKGFEVEAVAKPFRGFLINASVGHLDAKYISVLGPAQVAPNPFQAGVFDGAPLPRTPKWKFNVSPRYEVELPNKGNIVLLGDYTHTSSMWTDTERTLLLERPSTDIFNGSIQYKEPNDHWDLTLGMTNITNERYIVNGGANIAAGVIFGTWSRPREWYAKLGVKF